MATASPKTSATAPRPGGPNLATVAVVNLREHSIGRFTFQPGWTWAGSVKPIAGTEHCEKEHIGFCVSGRLDVWLIDGSRASPVTPT